MLHDSKKKSKFVLASLFNWLFTLAKYKDLFWHLSNYETFVERIELNQDMKRIKKRGLHISKISILWKYNKRIQNCILSFPSSIQFPFCCSVKNSKLGKIFTNYKNLILTKSLTRLWYLEEYEILITFAINKS